MIDPRGLEREFVLQIADRLDPDASDVSYEPPWPEIRRAKQVPPTGDWFVWLILAGRGFGKTRTGGEWFYERGMERKREMLLAGRTPGDVRDYSLGGPGGLLTQHPELRDGYEPGNRRIVFPTGSVAYIRSGANPEQFRNFSGDTVWIEEFCAWKYPSRAWHNLMFGVRERDPRITITTTPKPISALTEIMELPGTEVVRGSTDENVANLSDRWIENVVEPMRGTRLGRQEIDAEVLEDVAGAVWSSRIIEALRIKPPSEVATPLQQIRWLAREHDVTLDQVGIGVDPSGGKAEVGICAVGRGRCGYCGVDDRHGFVLEDASDEFERAGWGEAVVDLYHDWNANTVYGETNFGGDMVENTIATVPGGDAVAFEYAHASRGKARRAEPVGSMYKHGAFHHVGAHPELEDEMTSYVEGESDWSPNRMDALVWAAVKLFGLESRKSRSKEPKKTKVGAWSF